MSGGHFGYYQRHMNEIVDSIEDYLYGHELSDNDVDAIVNDRWTDYDEKKYVTKHHRSMPNRYDYTQETLDEFKKGVELIKQAYVYAQRIDWLMSGDDGEESFHRRLKEDLDDLQSEDCKM